MPIKPLCRLMFAQGEMCFFCTKPLPRSEASVEHLVLISRGGSNSDDNCVACCQSINRLLGSMSLKEKLRVVLNQKGEFICPKDLESARVPSTATPQAATTPTASQKSTASQSSSAPQKSTASQNSSATPKATPSRLTGLAENYGVILRQLTQNATSRPQRVKTLKNFIRSRFNGPKSSLTETQLESLIHQLEENGKITIAGTRVIYSL